MNKIRHTLDARIWQIQIYCGDSWAMWCRSRSQRFHSTTTDWSIETDSRKAGKSFGSIIERQALLDADNETGISLTMRRESGSSISMFSESESEKLSIHLNGVFSSNKTRYWCREDRERLFRLKQTVDFHESCCPNSAALQFFDLKVLVNNWWHFEMLIWDVHCR
jgi:hypothetical protein